jgi:hypothetical protein
MDLFTRKDLWQLVTVSTAPCVSIYLPTHAGGAEEDVIRWKNLLGQAESDLSGQGLSVRQIRDLLAPAQRFLEDGPFWKSMSEGLAYFLAPGLARLYRVPLALPELVVVGPHCHVKPLLPLITEEGRFYILALNQNRVRLLQGTAHRVREVNLQKVPHSLAEALRFTDRDEPLLFHTRSTGGKGSWGAIFHGHGVGIDDAKDDLLRYFQAVNQGLREVFRLDHAPLVLASVVYLWPLYRQANTYAALLPDGVPGNPDRLSDAELHERAWPVVEPYFRAARQKAMAQFRQLAGTGRTSTDLAEIVRAAREGQIETLFVCRDKQQWGSYDPIADTVVRHQTPEAGDEELLNYAAIQTILHRGTVYSVPATELPEQGNAAAVYWFPFVRYGQYDFSNEKSWT